MQAFFLNYGKNGMERRIIVFMGGGGGGSYIAGLAFHLDLQTSLDSRDLISFSDFGATRMLSHISKGYTRAFASTAPVEPATA